MDLCDLDRSRVAAFHERLKKDKIVAAFGTPDRLAAELTAALQRHGATALDAAPVIFTTTSPPSKIEIRCSIEPSSAM